MSCCRRRRRSWTDSVYIEDARKADDVQDSASKRFLFSGKVGAVRKRCPSSIRPKFWADLLSEGLFCCILKIYVVNKIFAGSRYLAVQGHHNAWMYEALAPVLAVISAALPVFFPPRYLLQNGRGGGGSYMNIKQFPVF